MSHGNSLGHENVQRKYLNVYIFSHDSLVFFFFFIFFIGLSRCSNDLPIHPGFWPTNNITIHIVHVLA